MIRLIFIAALTATPAFSLSCLPPDAVRLYETARDAEESYMIVKGRLIETGPIAIPQPDPNSIEQVPPVASTARFRGQALGPTDFSAPFVSPITVTVSCAMTWCGAPVTDRDLIVALRVTELGYALDIGPCGGDTVPYDPEGEARLLDCHRGAECQPADF